MVEGSGSNYGRRFRFHWGIRLQPCSWMVEEHRTPTRIDPCMGRSVSIYLKLYTK